jgi:hypothetical protein
METRPFLDHSSLTTGYPRRLKGADTRWEKVAEAIGV